MLSNYRSVSNLPIVSKVLKKVASSHLTSYLEAIGHGLQEEHQSDYRKHHSTETAQVPVQNNVMAALGGQRACLVVLLDLSAAFCTVDHSHLLKILCEMGAKAVLSSGLKVILAIVSKLYVCIGKESSSPLILECGMPQVSVLGPVLFTVYTSSLGQLLRSHSMNYTPSARGLSISQQQNRARAFGSAGPKLWNELPLEARNSTGLTSFKSKLKTHLFRQFYSTTLV